MSKIQFQDNPKVQELLGELFQQVACWVNAEGAAKKRNADNVESVFFDIIKEQVEMNSVEREAN